MDAEHTATPWFVGKDYYGGMSIRTKPTPATNIIGEDAVFENTGRSCGDMSPEDAQFIVKACNAYETDQKNIKDLLAACESNRDAIRFVLRWIAGEIPRPSTMGLVNTLAIAEAALLAMSKAEAKPAPIPRVTVSCAKSVKILQDLVDEKEAKE